MVTGILLLALVGGYWVLTLSVNQPKPLNTLGRIVGAVVLIVALGGLICTAVCRAKSACGGGSCAMSAKMAGCGMEKKMGCPMGGDKAAAPVEHKAQ